MAYLIINIGECSRKYSRDFELTRAEHYWEPNFPIVYNCLTTFCHFLQFQYNSAIKESNDKSRFSALKEIQKHVIA